MKQLVDEGKVRYLGLSKASAETLPQPSGTRYPESVMPLLKG